VFVLLDVTSVVVKTSYNKTKTKTKTIKWDIKQVHIGDKSSGEKEIEYHKIFMPPLQSSSSNISILKESAKVCF